MGAQPIRAIIAGRPCGQSLRIQVRNQLIVAHWCLVVDVMSLSMAARRAGRSRERACA